MQFMIAVVVHTGGSGAGQAPCVLGAHAGADPLHIPISLTFTHWYESAQSLLLVHVLGT